MATKLEAFKGRGRGDFLGSHDFADVIALVDGRDELVGEIEGADADLRLYVANEVAGLLAADRFLDGIFGALRPDAGSQARAEEIVLPRLRRLAAEPH